VATWNADLTRKGPGLLLQDIRRGEDPQIAAVVQGVVALDADVLLLTGIDYDHQGVALNALADLLTKAGTPYPHRFALRPNTGMPTGLDLDGNGYLGDARDAMGYGRFAGAEGMALLSRLPINAQGAVDHSAYLWADLPGAMLPPTMPEPHRAMQRLPTTNHWQVPVTLPGGRSLTVMAWLATPPVFDGPEDRNGRRNHDEAMFWVHLLNNALPVPPPDTPFVLMGDGNLDPADGDGLRAGISTLLAHPALQDPEPRGTHGRTEPAHAGDPALDTADYGPTGPGALRVDYVLPSADLPVTAAGVLWPGADDPLAANLRTASRHAPVWVDVELP